MSKFKYQIPVLVRDEELKKRIDKQCARHELSWNKFMLDAAVKHVERLEKLTPISEQEV